MAFRCQLCSAAECTLPHQCNLRLKTLLTYTTQCQRALDEWGACRPTSALGIRDSGATARSQLLSGSWHATALPILEHKRFILAAIVFTSVVASGRDGTREIGRDVPSATRSEIPPFTVENLQTPGNWHRYRRIALFYRSKCSILSVGHRERNENTKYRSILNTVRDTYLRCTCVYVLHRTRLPK